MPSPRARELRAGGTYDGLFYRPTVLANPPRDAAAYSDEVFGPVASVVSYRPMTRPWSSPPRPTTGWRSASSRPTCSRGSRWRGASPPGIVHINDQTVNDEANAPFGGVGSSGTGSRHGGAQANIDAFTETRWITMRREPGAYPL